MDEGLDLWKAVQRKQTNHTHNKQSNVARTLNQLVSIHQHILFVVWHTVIMCKRICAIVVVAGFDPFHLCTALINPNIMKGRTAQADK
jgi:trehalose/maltose hydrolase-like predicted phosphorylase